MNTSGSDSGGGGGLPYGEYATISNRRKHHIRPSVSVIFFKYHKKKPKKILLSSFAYLFDIKTRRKK